jgi:two-component system, cell cycle sensor histidine kinase and response regulator CckA
MTEDGGHCPTAKNTPLEDTLVQEQILLLLRNSRTAAVVNICIACLTFLAIPCQRHVWLWLILGVAGFRLVAYYWFKRSSRPPGELKTMYFVTLLLVALQGATWGFASLLLYNSTTDFHRFYLIAILCGMTGGAVLTLTPSILAFACFTLPAVLPMIFTFLVQTDATFRHAGLMGVVFLLAVLFLAKRICQSNLELIQSRNRLELTTRELARHKNNLEVLVEARTRELAHSRETYRRLTEEINDAIFELDTEGRVTYISPAITAVSGYQPEQITGCYFSDFIHCDDLPKLRHRFHEVLEGILEPAEFRIVNHAGEPHWVRSSSRPIAGADGPSGLRGILTDIANEKREMHEKTQLLQQLHDNQKLEAIGTLAGGIAHDFNNILNVIIGFCEITRSTNADNGPIRDNMDKVLKASERARGLIRQILTFSKKSKQGRELVEPHILLREGIELLSGSIPKTIKILENINQDSAPILADPAQFNQIVFNLCTNAYYAMKESGGVLEISLDSTVVDAEKAAFLSELPAGRYVRLQVRDTGQGIPEPERQRIFEPFYTTKPTGEGSGLGLSVIHGVIRSMGGAITVASDVGKGSVFTVYLPRQDMEIPPTGESSRDTPQGNGERILVVDDEEMIATLEQELLSSLGYRVSMSTSGKDGLKKFLAEPFAFDAVITDQTMPEVTGLQLADTISTVRPDLPVIICSGYSETINDETAADMNIAAFLNKPIGRDMLAKTLREVLALKDGG